MAQNRPAGRSPAEIEDVMLRRVLRVTLSEPPPGGSAVGADATYLEQLAAELMSESHPLLLSREVMDRVMIERLSNPPESASVDDAPFLYLLGCYRRASDEARKVQSMKDKVRMAELLESLNQVRELVMSYVGITLEQPDMFPQPVAASAPSKENSPLSTLILADAAGGVGGLGMESSFGAAPAASLPHGFLEHLVKRFESDPTLENILAPVFKELQASVIKMSALGAFQAPLRALVMLISYPSVAKALVRHPMWHPQEGHVNGRVLELCSILGPFFRISGIPDNSIFGNVEPNVGQQCFSDVTSRRPADLMSSFATIKNVMHQLYDGLHEVLLKLLKVTDTRECVLQYLSDVIQKNAGRSQMQVDPFACASTGMFVSLGAVMLKLCDPFLDPSFSKRDKIESSYVLNKVRIDFSGLTAIHATSDEIAKWVDKRNYARVEGFRQAQLHMEQEERRRLQMEEPTSSSSPILRGSAASTSAAAATSKYSFICECFFLTARVLNLGLVKALSDYKNLAQELSRQKEALESLKAMRGPGALPNLETEITQVENAVERLSQERLCYEAQIFKDTELIHQGLNFYRLMIVWLVDLVGGFGLPLPADCPMDFASMPEHFVEDAMELLLIASRIPKGLDGIVLEEFMSFIAMFMGSPLHVKNPYLRAKMVEVLNAWMPQKSSFSTALSNSMASLFEGHQLAQECLVPNLLKLYVDIEFTGSHNQFYDKFNIRHNIAELLEYLWEAPGHHNQWKKIAMKEEKGFYLRFLNLLINDSIFLLDESLKKIPELKEMEAEMANTAEWELRPQQERQERARFFRRQEMIVRNDMMLANEDVKMLQYTSAEITAPFLLPEMVERIASMLNYFLLQLVGPQRGALKLKDPEKYEFRPKELLSQIVDIYVHVARGDKDGVFSKAISSDGRSFNAELFFEAAKLIKQLGTHPEKLIEDFRTLGANAKKAAEEAVDTESMLGDIPEEFLDPIQYTLMRDPVLLPSSNITLDRSTIQRHLLSDQTDPFNRSFLTPEMLVPNTEVKARIEEYIRSRGLKL